MDLDKIRKLVIIALFSDDELMNRFVLKGGNALNIVYDISNRASIDIDVSMENDFDKNELEDIKKRLEKELLITFGMENYRAFDIKLFPQPRRQDPRKNKFWGGYRLEFKIIEEEKYNEDIEFMRRNAEVIGSGQKKTFKVDISKYEYCKDKIESELDGFTIYVYSPLMLIYEKLRAICQQLEDYIEMLRTNRRGRAQDFFDIYIIIEEWDKFSKTALYKYENLLMLKEIFEIKKVPLNFLTKIEQDREWHRDSFTRVQATADPSYDLKDYDFYFDYIVELADNLFKSLKSFRII